MQPMINWRMLITVLFILKSRGIRVLKWKCIFIPKAAMASFSGKTVYVSGTVTLEKSIFWKKQELTLTTAANVKPTTDARFVISTNRTGLYYFNLVSLFPPPFKNRSNGNRPD